MSQKKIGYCLNYIGVNFFINVQNFIVIDKPKYHTLLAVYDAVRYEPVICMYSKLMIFQSFFVYRLYHNSEESMHPCRDFNNYKFSILKPFFICILFLCSVFTSHVMYTNSPSNFHMIFFSSGMSILGYDPGTSKMATYLPSCASIMRRVNSYSKYMVGNYSSYLGM